MKRTIRILDITRDPKLQIRDAMNAEALERYADEYREADPAFRPGALGAIGIVSDGESFWLVDGWHRLHAAETAGMTEILADVTSGRFDDARLAAAGANTKHGLARTDETKRRAVLVLLDEPQWRTWSDKMIAKHCGCSRPWVQRLRAEAHFDDSKDQGLTRQPATEEPVDAQTPDLSWRVTAPAGSDQTMTGGESEALARSGRRKGADGRRRPASAPKRPPARMVPDAAELHRQESEAGTEEWRPPESIDAITQRDADTGEEVWGLLGKLSKALGDAQVTSHVGANEVRWRQVVQAHARVHGDHDWTVRLSGLAMALTELLQADEKRRAEAA